MKYKSVMQDLSERRCYLCARLYGDETEKVNLHHHHVFC